jgi:hypothetical protein
MLLGCGESIIYEFNKPAKECVFNSLIVNIISFSIKDTKIEKKIMF